MKAHIHTMLRTSTYRRISDDWPWGFTVFFTKGNGR